LHSFLQRASITRAQQNVTVGETPQQVNDRIELSPWIEEFRSARLRDWQRRPAGNLVFDVPELSKEVRVSQTGSISIPLIPTRIHLTGLSETQAEVKIAELLERTGWCRIPRLAWP